MPRKKQVTKPKSVFVRVYERVVNEKKSTYVGFILLVASFTLVVLNKIEWETWVAFLPTCLGLMYVKDSVFEP